MRIRNTLIGLFGVMSFGLSSCAASVTSSSEKANLEKEGYSVTIQAKDEYLGTLTFKLESTDNLVDYLTASKENGENFNVLFAWNFKTIDDANTFFDSNKTFIYGAMEAVKDTKTISSEVKSGIHNNVAFIGTEAAVTTAGLTL